MKKETIKNTTHSNVYNKLLKRKLWNESGLCPLCGPHSGCNSRNKLHLPRNWKNYRKTKWK